MTVSKTRTGRTKALYSSIYIYGCTQSSHPGTSQIIITVVEIERSSGQTVITMEMGMEMGLRVDKRHRRP
jgi:hypothetical protein